MFAVCLNPVTNYYVNRIFQLLDFHPKTLEVIAHITEYIHK